MVFTSEQDAFILMAHFRSGTRNPDGTWSYSLQSCIEQFSEAFPNVIIEYDTFKKHKLRLIARYENKHCICKGKSTGRPSVLTEEVVNDIQQRMEQSPKKSIPQLSAQTGLSTGTCHKALKKKLHLHPYKISSVHQLHAPDYNLRVQYCQWFNERLNNNNLLDLTFYSDEAWVHLSGYVNSQNYRIWAAENPHVYVETPLHPQKVGIWVAMSRRRIIGPIFFYDTINGDRYRDILRQAIEEHLHDDEQQRGFFQQDGASAHTANETIRYLQQFYGDRIISTGLWPPRSPDLTPLDFFLFGRIKTNIFKNRLHTLEELEGAIQQEINNITPIELEHVFENMKRRVNLCLEMNGGHFEHLL